MDAQTDQTIATDGAPEAGVVAASVYSGGRRIKDIAIEDAGEWSQRPGHVVWIGLFVDRAEAVKFAMFENGHRPQAVIMVPGILELDMSGKPGASDQADAQPALARAA